MWVYLLFTATWKECECVCVSMRAHADKTNTPSGYCPVVTTLQLSGDFMTGRNPGSFCVTTGINDTPSAVMGTQSSDPRAPAGIPRIRHPQESERGTQRPPPPPCDSALAASGEASASVRDSLCSTHPFLAEENLSG